MPEVKYLIDSCSLITPFNGSYQMDIFPGFWDKMKEKILSGEIVICRKVYDEILTFGDELSNWLKEIIDGGTPLIEPDLDIISTTTEIGDHVDKRNPPYKSSAVYEFMGSGDLFIIATAKSKGYTIITEEKYVPDSKAKVKIPNVCREENIPYINLIDYIKQAGFKFL